MLKLVKYDFRRNRDMILAVFVVTIIVQIWIGFVNFTEQEMFSLNAVVYVIAVLIVYVFALRTYVHNLKSYNRRLLPIKTLYTVLSPMVLFLFLLLGVVMMVLIHLGVYAIMYSTSYLPTSFWKGASFSVVLLFWFTGFSMLLVMFSITVALSIRFKGRVWIGIVTCFILQYVISFLEEWIFEGSMSDNALRVGLIDESTFRSMSSLSREVSIIWPTLFEALIALIMLYGIVKLVKKRVET